MARSGAGKAGRAGGTGRAGREAIVARVIGELEAHARPLHEFDPDRYFRTTTPTTFLNTGTPFQRGLGKAVAREHKGDWNLADALTLADTLVRDSRFEAKSVGIEVLACFHRQYTPEVLPVVKRWLAQDHCANWATTDSLCGYVIGPLLGMYPALIPAVTTWTAHRNLWVRRAAAVSLIKPAVKQGGAALDAAFAVATALRGDPHDLIHKAAGWLLRETGRVDRDRLIRYLREGGSRIPRTTLRYAIERFPAALRAELLASTRPGATRR